jgi:hypothetical protein
VGRVGLGVEWQSLGLEGQAEEEEADGSAYHCKVGGSRSPLDGALSARAWLGVPTPSFGMGEPTREKAFDSAVLCGSLPMGKHSRGSEK